MKVYFEHVDAPPIEVRWADLPRWDPGRKFASCCPECPDGMLMVYRRLPRGELRRLDRCIVCGQQVIYTDAEINGEGFDDS